MTWTAWLVSVKQKYFEIESEGRALLQTKRPLQHNCLPEGISIWRISWWSFSWRILLLFWLSWLNGQTLIRSEFLFGGWVFLALAFIKASNWNLGRSKNCRLAYVFRVRKAVEPWSSFGGEVGDLILGTSTSACCARQTLRGAPGGKGEVYYFFFLFK